MHPSSGGRVVLDLVPGDEIAYDAALYTPSQVWHGHATIAPDGTVTFSPWQPADAPPWLVALAQAFLRSEWKARKGEDPPPWPARIQRWREAKE
jgi:hypothetical protein